MPVCHDHKDLGDVTDKLTQTVNSHGAGLNRIQPHNKHTALTTIIPKNTL